MKITRCRWLFVVLGALLAAGCASSSSEPPPEKTDLEVDGPTAKNESAGDGLNAASESAENALANDSAAGNLAENGSNPTLNGNASSENLGSNGFNAENPSGNAGLNNQGLNNGGINNGGINNGGINNAGLNNGGINNGGINNGGINNGGINNGGINNGGINNAGLNNASLTGENELDATGSLEGSNQEIFNPDTKPAQQGSSAPSLSMGLGNTAVPSNATVPSNSAIPNATTANATVSPPSNGVPPLASDTSVVTPVEPPGEPAAAPRTAQFKALSEEEKAFWTQAASRLKNLAPGEGPSEYVVQAGDTLWDICDQLLDDYRWWPKLWTLNPQIQNPHLIYPGQKLVFGASDGTRAPSLAVREIEKATPVSTDSRLVTQKPENLVHPWHGKENEHLDASELAADPFFDIVGADTTPTTILVPIPGFLSSNEPDSVGEIVRVGEGYSITPRGRVTYAELSRAPTPGERFLAVRPSVRPMNPAGDDGGSTDLYLYTGVVGVAKTHASGLASLVVEDSRHGVQVGDLLIPYRNIFQQVDPRAGGRPAGVKAEVLATGDEHRSVGGEGSVVLLEKIEGNAAPGDDIEIFMPAGSLVNFQSDDLDASLVARARVLDSTEEGISAFILSSQREVSVGAKTWSSDF